MIAAAFIGCSQKPAFGATSADTNGNGLRDDVELEILKYYFDKKTINPNDYVVEYFGTYNEATVLIMYGRGGIGLGEIEHETVAGFRFGIVDGKKIWVWYGNELYELKEAYESGILTDEDIEAIHKVKYNK